MASLNIESLNVGSRTNDLKWDDYFMAVALLTAQRSKDPVSQVGACIVNRENKIVGTGYNGMPKGCNDDEFPWCKGSLTDLNNKHLYVCHAELNAVLNKNSADVKNCTIYVNLFPCNECAKVIIQSGIKEVIYITDKKPDKIESKAAKKMFNAAGVKYRKHAPKQRRIIINLDDEKKWNYKYDYD